MRRRQEGAPAPVKTPRMELPLAEEVKSRLHANLLDGLRVLASERPGEDLLYASASGSGRGTALPEAGRPVYAHTAQGVELAIVRRGAVLMLAPGQLLRLTPGRLLVIERGAYHAEFPGHANRGHRVLWCHLYRNQVVLADSTFSPSRGIVSPDVRLAGPTNLERIGDTICSELASRGLGYHRAVFGLLTYLSWLLIRRLRRGPVVLDRVLESPAPTGDRRTWLAIQNALEFCDRNFRSGVSREGVAKAVGYSPSHLGHLISSHLGQSLSDYLSNLRITEAKRLLEESDVEFREIAASVGYSDPAHFTRAFRRATGLSPTDYRRRLEVM